MLAAACSGLLLLLVAWIGLTTLTSLTRGCQCMLWGVNEAVKTQCVYVRTTSRGVGVGWQPTTCCCAACCYEQHSGGRDCKDTCGHWCGMNKLCPAVR
jgi:hypothetical protein